MSATIIFGGDFGVSYFTAQNTEPGFVRLAAVVVQCGPQPTSPKAPSKSRIRNLRNILGIGRRAPAPDDFHPLPDGFNSGTGMGGPREVLYSESRYVVRVAGTEFSCPSDCALVILVAHGTEGVAPTFETLTLDSPPMPFQIQRPTLVPGKGVPEAIKDEMHNSYARQLREQGAAWSSAITTNPAVQDFIARHRS